SIPHRSCKRRATAPFECEQDGAASICRSPIPRPPLPAQSLTSPTIHLPPRTGPICLLLSRTSRLILPRSASYYAGAPIFRKTVPKPYRAGFPTHLHSPQGFYRSASKVPYTLILGGNADDCVVARG